MRLGSRCLRLRLRAGVVDIHLYCSQTGLSRALLIPRGARSGKLVCSLQMRDSEAYSDTDPQALQVWLNLLRKMSPSEKIATVFDLTRFARGMAELGVRSRYPNASEREVFLRTAALYLSREQMIRAYQWDPQEHERSGARI